MQIAGKQISGYMGRNYLHNGAMDIWQRSTSTAISSGAAYVADRWNVICSGGSGLACTNSQDTDVPSVTLSGSVFTYSNKITVTTAEAAITGTELFCWKYNVEGYDWRNLWQRDMTLSFWFKSNKSGTYGVGLNNYGAGSVPDRAFAKSFTYIGGTGWQRIIINVPASPSAGTWLLANNEGLRIYITLAAGSSYAQSVTEGQWNTVAQYNCAPANISNTAGDSNGNCFWMVGAQLELGSHVSPFDYRLYQQELSLCQRYCVVLDGSQGYYPYVLWGSFATGGPTCYTWTRSPVPMRTVGGSINATHNVTTGLTNGTPSSTGVNVFNNNAQLYGFGTYSSFSAVNYSGGSLYLALTGSGLTNCTGGALFYYLLGSSVKIVFSDDM